MITAEQRRQLGIKRSNVAYIIRYEMSIRGWTGESLGKMLGCSRKNISNLLRGIHHSPKVLDALREIGVPEELLFDPRRVPQSKLKEAQRQERV